MIKLSFFIFIISLYQSFLYRKLFSESSIPESFQEFLKDPKGICVYLLFDDYDRVYKTNKNQPFKNPRDYLSVEKIVNNLKGEKVFLERWSEFKEHVQRIKNDKLCNKKMILTYESFFSEYKQNSYDQLQIFTPVSKKFMDEKLEELKYLSDENTLIAMNQIVMSEEVNKSCLNTLNQQFLNECRQNNEYDTFCTIIEHNDNIIQSQELIVPYLSSDIFIVHQQQLIFSYAKQMPFTEMLTEFWKDIPQIYQNVFFKRKPQYKTSDNYKKVFFSEICFDHQFEQTCYLPQNQLFWILLSNSVLDNDRKIEVGQQQNMIMIKHDKKDTGSYVRLLSNPSHIIPKLQFSRIDYMFFVRYQISSEIISSAINQVIY